MPIDMFRMSSQETFYQKAKIDRKKKRYVTCYRLQCWRILVFFNNFRVRTSGRPTVCFSAPLRPLVTLGNHIHRGHRQFFPSRSSGRAGHAVMAGLRWASSPIEKHFVLPPIIMQAANLSHILLSIASYHHTQELTRPAKEWLAKLALLAPKVFLRDWHILPPQ